MSPIPFRLRAIIAVTGCAAVLAACGGATEDSEPPPLDTADRGGAAATPSSTPTADRQGTAAQEFPIPAPEGGEIITDEWDGTTGYITLRYPAERYDEVVGFYDDYASGSGWNRSEVGQGDVASVNQMNLMEGLNIAIDPPMGGTMVVTLTIS